MFKVTNLSKGTRTFNVKYGEGVRTVPLLRGATAELDLVDRDHPALKGREASGEIKIEGKATKPKSASSGYAVKDKGAGWYVVTKDGAEVTKSLRKDAVEGFDAKSDEEKATFVDTNKAED